MQIIHCNTTPQSRFHGFLKGTHAHFEARREKLKATDCDLTEGDHPSASYTTIVQAGRISGMTRLKLGFRGKGCLRWGDTHAIGPCMHAAYPWPAHRYILFPDTYRLWNTDRQIVDLRHGLCNSAPLHTLYIYVNRPK